MAISAFSDITVGGSIRWIAGWDARTSAPTASPTTGLISSYGAELSGWTNGTGGSPASFAAINTPRWNGGAQPGVICPINQEVDTSKAGFRVILPTPPSGAAWNPKRLLVVTCITPLNMIGDNSQGVGRVWTSDVVFASVQKNWKNGAGGSNNGNLTVHGGGATQLTVGLNGCERQVVGFRSTNAGGAWGYCNVDGSENTTAATGSGTAITQLEVGCRVGSTNGPFVGVIHAIHVFAIESTAATDFTEQQLIDCIDLLATQWSVTKTATVGTYICGDSIGFSSGTKYDTEWTNWASKKQTTLTSSPGALATSFTVANGTGFINGARYTIGHGTALAETVTVSTVSGNTINLSGTGTRLAHTAGETFANDAYGFTDVYSCVWHASKVAGDGSGRKLFNYSTGSAQLQNALANPPSDGSMDIYSACTTRIAVCQRGTNDIIAAGRTGDQVLNDAKTYAANARAQASPATKVVVCRILPRVDASAGHNTHIATFNAGLVVGADFDAVVKWDEHPWLTQPTDPGTITVTGATAATTLTGKIWDNAGVHPRGFGNVCQALHVDTAMALALGISVPYAPSLPTVSGAREAGGMRVNWTTPTSPNAPAFNGDTTSGASCLCVKVRRVRAGTPTQIALVAPATLNANTGAATYTTTYLDAGYQAGDTYTLEVVDAAGNTSGLQAWVPPAAARSGMTLGTGLGLGV